MMAGFRLKRTQDPAQEPLQVSDIKAFLRVDHDDDDAVIGNLIVVARELCEQMTGRALISQGYSLFVDSWPHKPCHAWWDGQREGVMIPDYAPALDIPKAPIISVEQVLIYDGDGNAVEYASANYYVDNNGYPPRLYLNQNAPAPTAGRTENGIEIRFTAGYGETTDSVPEGLKQAMRQIIAHLYENRGDQANAARISGAQGIFETYRLRGGAL